MIALRIYSPQLTQFIKFGTEFMFQKIWLHMIWQSIITSLSWLVNKVLPSLLLSYFPGLQIKATIYISIFSMKKLILMYGGSNLPSKLLEILRFNLSTMIRGLQSGMCQPQQKTFFNLTLMTILITYCSFVSIDQCRFTKNLCQL